MLDWQIFGMTWWILLIWIVFFVYTFIKIWRLVDEAHTYRVVNQKRQEVISIRIALKEVYFYGQKYFTLWDIVRMFFNIPAIVLATALLLLKVGIWEFFPFFRKVFGFKLFRISKEE